MSNPFTKAARQSAKLKLAITGPSGSGKTTAALRCARGLVGDKGKIAVIDTENKSASLYSDITNFDVLNLEAPFNHSKFSEAIQAAEANGYDCVIIDSASHLWEAILEYKSKLDKRPGGNSYTNWNEAGSKFKEVIDCLLASNLHVISCLRSKMEYILSENDKGKMAPQKVGMAPIMRDGIEYEFTVVLDLEMDHLAKSSKDRTRMFDGQLIEITEQTGKHLFDWLSGGEPAKAQPAKTQPAPAKADPLPNAKIIQPGEHIDPLEGKKLSAEINVLWKELGKSDADIVKACKAVGSKFTAFSGLSVAQLETVRNELLRQKNKKANTKKEPDPVDEDLPMVHIDDLEKQLPAGSEPQVNEYLIKLHYIKEGQTYRDLDATKVEKILSKFDNLLRVAGVSKEAA